MRIAQITDLHIGHEGEDTFGIDVRENFMLIKQAVQELSPDLVVLSGDLCYRSGNRDIYSWIKDHMEDMGIPYEFISGNHDDPALMARVFGREDLMKNGELYFSRQIADQKFLFLDTTLGVISWIQMDWLQRQLEEWDRDIVIFMHHPPFFAGVPYMDEKYSFRTQEEIQRIFFAFPHNITVFTGHYHVDKTIRKRNVVVHITPSCFFQIDQHSADFRVDHRRIGFREITLDDGLMMNTVKYVND